jgi:anti-anti-sigma regulatory factor
MKISESYRDGILVVGFDGDSDAWSVPGVRERLVELLTNASGVVVFDLSHAEGIDDGGVSLLCDCKRRLVARGQDLIIGGEQEALKAPLRKAHLIGSISAASIDEAITMASPTMDIDPSSLLNDLDDEEL